MTDETTLQFDLTPPDQAQLAELAARQFTRASGVGSVLGEIAGSYAPVALLGTVAITHAELVLHVAATYGADPTDPRRAADLLVITRVHPTLADAEAALDACRRTKAGGGVTSAIWRLGRMVFAPTAGWALLRLANRHLPGISMLAGTASSQAVAARAIAHYRGCHTD